MEDEPGFAELSVAQLDAIIRRHLPDVALESVERLPSTGVVNSIYALGSRYVLRVPHATEGGLRDTLTEAVAAPVAREARVRTPALIAFDESCALLDVPFTIFERAPGRSLASATMDDPSNAPIWRDLGHELAILHMRVETCADPKGWLDQPGRDELPSPFLDALSSTGYLSPDLHHWLGTLLDRLQPAVHQARTYRRFLHNDATPSNVIADKGCFSALIDWGDAGWGDPALEFRCLPLRVVPEVLAGYRQVGPLDGDDNAEARIVHDHIVTALFYATRAAEPQTQHWGRPPVGRLLEILAFATDHPDDWARWIA